MKSNVPRVLVANKITVIMLAWRVVRIGSIAWLFFCVSVSAQSNNEDYPDWFLRPPQGSYVIGLSYNYSKGSASREKSLLDASAMVYLTNGGKILANTIFYKGRLADSVGLELENELEQLELMLVVEASVQDIYMAQYEYFEPQAATLRGDSLGVSGQRIYAVGKQTIRPGKLYESWSSAEIEAFKELSRVKEAKLRSIIKADGKELQVLIQLQSHTRLNNARIERRWIAGNVLHVEASDTF